MKMLLGGLLLAASAGLTFAPPADAAPLRPLNISALPGGRVSVGVGIGIGVGAGYGGGYYQPTYAYTGGYYRTEYRWVPVTTLVGYDVYRRPLYQTRYLPEAYQVWVPRVRYYAPYYRGGTRAGVAVGYRWP